jgi:hypothetical protein
MFVIYDGFNLKSSTNGTWFLVEESLKLEGSNFFQIGNNIFSVSTC